MSRSLHIGGVRFSMEAPHTVKVVSTDPLYEGFRRPPPEKPGISETEVAVRFRTASPATTTDGPLIFDTGDSWFARSDGDNLVFSMRDPESADTVLWSARLSKDRRVVEVMCNDRLWSDDPMPTLHDPLTYPLDQLLTMMILGYRRRGAVLHSAGLIHEHRAIACVGVSGAGKSTLVEVLANSFEAVSDDRVVIRVDGELPVLFGTPWAGEGRSAQSRSAPLSAIAFLHQAPHTESRPLSKKDALVQLLPCLAIPWFSEPTATDVLAVAERLLEEVPAWELHFRPHREVRETVASFL